MNAISIDTAADRTAGSQSSRIAGVRIQGAGEGLELVLTDGETYTLAAEMVWRECPSAQGKMRRSKGLHHAAPAGLRIVTLREIGHYAVNIAFSDGHDRGIYPWSYLWSLAQRPRMEDYIIADEVSSERDRAQSF